MAAGKVRAHALTFIFISVLLDMLALGVMAPVLTPLIKSFTHADVSAVQWIGIFATIFAVMQFFFSPVLGVLSDRFGRRPVILLSNLGLGLDYVIMALAPSLWWLLIGRIVAGITSSNITVAYAYISDVAAPEERAAGFGMIGAAFGIGFVLGPAIGGLLSQHGNLRLPFWISAGFSVLNFLYGYFVLPESLPREKRSTTFALSRANPLGSVRLLRSHRELSGISIAYFFAMVAHDVAPTVWVIYGIYRYHWDQRTIGLSLAAMGISQIVVSAKLVAPAVKWLGDRRAMIAGYGFGVLGFSIFGIAQNNWVFFLGIPVSACWAIATPGLQAIASRHISQSEQGELQGALGMIRGVSTIIGPGLFAATFGLFIGRFSNLHLYGAPWFLAGLLLATTCIIGYVVTRRDSDIHDVPPPLAEIEVSQT